MLLTCMRMERKKLRHSRLWLLFLLIPVIPAVLGGANYLGNLEILKSGWYSLWTQHSLFYANFFYGPLIAIYCAYIWRVEHLNYNWNSLMTMPVPVRDIFLSKLFLAFGCTLRLQIWMWVVFVIAGKIVGLTALPPLSMLIWIFRGALGGMSIAALQLLLSMVIRSFSVPIALALLGSIAGLLFSNMNLGLYWPYSLMMLGMNANRTENMVSNVFAFAGSVFVFTVIFAGIGIWYLKKRDIHAM